MAQEIELGGTIYISSKRAAEITDYAQDYIGQLCRSGQIEAKRISGLWYVLEESLRAYKEKADTFKPTPPRHAPVANLETSISFDGNDYISAQRAAKITGYSADYVGQLARSGKILSRQIGTRWYVDRAMLVEHKRHNDSLLAAVQAESVGIQKRDAPTEERIIDKEEPQAVHFSYVADAPGELIPTLAEREKDTVKMEESLVEDEEAVEEAPEKPAEEEIAIPIRIVKKPVVDIGEEPVQKITTRISVSRIVALSVIVLGVGISAFGGYTYLQQDKTRQFALASAASEVVQKPSIDTSSVRTAVERLFSKELVYQRR